MPISNTTGPGGIIGKTCLTQKCEIYIGGNIEKINAICRSFVEVGACVSITEVNYIYTGGEEFGACITIINYPRFNVDPQDVQKTAVELAQRLLSETDQLSLSIVSTGDINKTAYMAKPEKECQ